ncbi:MAG: hypothetical protein RIR26_2959 [Pseudomonadota bacterium]|jgi:predicted negative regulator of RcsB-dependent stress response
MKPTSQFLHNSRIFFSVLVSSTTIACATLPHEIPPPVQPQVQASGQKTAGVAANTEKPQQDITRSAAPFVTQFESALAKRDCTTIRQLESQLVAPPESYANSVVLAVLWCSHQKSPSDKDLLSKLLSALETTVKTEAPLFDLAFVEQLRADALMAAGETTASRQAFAKAIGQSALQFMNLVSGQVLRSELQTAESLLSGPQIALLKEIRTQLSDPNTQAGALSQFDELISQVPAGTTKDRLNAARLRLFSAIELSFASQIVSLEEARLRADAAGSEEAATRIRKLFPSRAHQLRIDSLIGTSASSKTAGSELTTSCNAPLTADTSANNEKGDLTADRALQLARTALNEGKPGNAVETLDTLSDAQKNEKTRSLRREASEAHVRELRRKANELFQRGNISTDRQSKLDSLSQCKQILENILVKYPDTDSFTRNKIQKFLNSVSENIVELRKAQAK